MVSRIVSDRSCARGGRTRWARDPSAPAEAARILPIVGISVGLLLAALALPGLAAGYGLLRHKPWARILAFVVGVLSLLNFPLGTIIGIYTFVVLMQPAAADYFAAPAPA